jgi:hypothetical protein
LFRTKKFALFSLGLSRPHLARWRFEGWVDVPALVRRTPVFYEYPMCDRDPLERWRLGRVTLLGDAAHPMYPVGSNGAAQAISTAGRSLDPLSSIKTWPRPCAPMRRAPVGDERNRAEQPADGPRACHRPRRGACARRFRARGGCDLARGARGHRRPVPQGRRFRARTLGPPRFGSQSVGHISKNVSEASSLSEGF